MQQDQEHDHNRVGIFVNARKRWWNRRTITYSQVVELAFPPMYGSKEVFTVQYNHGPKEDREGLLAGGQRVKVVDGMVFDVTRTDKS